MTPQQQAKFIAGLVPGAQAAQTQFGVFASVSIAQAIFESFWGKKAPGNNLFGIQAIGGWTGPTVMESTHEYVHGVNMPEVEKFRAYPDWLFAIVDHGKFLQENPRYAAAMRCKDGYAQAMAIAAAGYSTNPQYGQMLCQEIRARNLTQYDKT
jgi:flagellum-specific peptidoglycan hydrolase FlgJ